MSKAAIAKTLTPEECAAGVMRHCINEHAHKLMQGLYCLRAQALYALPRDARGQGRKSSPTVGRDSSPPENPGFDQWIQEQCAGYISRSTAYNYMLAAGKAGLTLEMSDDGALKAAEKALQGVAKLSDMYKALPAGDDTPPPSHEPPPVNPEQMWMDFMTDFEGVFANDSKVLRMLPRLPIPRIEDIERQLCAGLENVREVLKAKQKAKPKR